LIEKTDRVNERRRNAIVFGVSFEHMSCITCNGGCLMKSFFTCLIVFLGTWPCCAANPKIEEVVKTFDRVRADAKKLKIFCEMKKVMDARGDKQDTAADAKIQGYMKQLGSDFQTAWVASDDIDTDTPDGKALNAALDNLTGKCI
jgi:hypothetical protein